MNWKRVFAVTAILATVACGGGGSSNTSPTNRVPEVSFNFAPLATAHSVPVDLTVSATDPDGDPLTITWKITRGSLTAQNGGKTVMRWATPASLGVDTVTVKVSDGTATKTLTEEIRVGTTYTTGVFQKSKSPYILALNAADPRLSVDEGTTMTIEPGTEIYINTADTFFDVLGELDAHGTLDQPIIIRQNDRTFTCGSTNPGRWAGITASGATAVVDLEYVELWYPQNGVKLLSNSVATLKDVSVRCSGNAGVSMEGSGFLRAINSKFTDGLGNGVAIFAIASLPDSVRVEGCTLSFNQGSGIRMDLDDQTKSVPIIVKGNDIEFNATHGISLAHAVFPQIHSNNFRGNGDSTVSSLYLQSGYPSVTNLELDATCNFWGAASASQIVIDIGIHDSLDQSTVHTRVKSCPWLNSNPLTTTADCSMSCP